jgi:hypothetical protein
MAASVDSRKKQLDKAASILRGQLDAAYLSASPLIEILF